jgi:metallo-beta-lactamase family protein
VRPLYTEADVEATLPRFTPVDYDRPVAAAQGVTVAFRDAGHILGSAMLEIDAREGGRRARVVFTGDLGRAGMPILRDPYRSVEADVLVTESTYGGRLHAPIERARERLARLVSRVAARGGKIVVPAFAVGRTQALLYELHVLVGEGRVPRLPVFVDSPLAVGATDLFARHPECFDEEMLALVRRHDDPLGLGRVTYVRSAAESRALAGRRGPMVVVSASGMCEGGRVLHHLRQAVGNGRNAVLLVGFQAEGTLGARLAAGEDRVRILGETHAVRAEVAAFDEFSAHADAEGLEAFATGFRRPPRLTVVVHGNEENALALGRRLSSRGLARVAVPFDGESLEF